MGLESGASRYRRTGKCDGSSYETQFVDEQEGSLLVLDEKKKELVFAMTIGSRSLERPLIGHRVPLGKGIGLAAEMHEVQVDAPAFKTRRAIYSCVIACIVFNVPKAG